MEISRTVGPVLLELVPEDAGLDLEVSYNTGRSTWRGIASFPWEMEDEAMLWMERIRTENDLEDLFRTWSSAETWGDFQRIRSLVGA